MQIKPGLQFVEGKPCTPQLFNRRDNNDNIIITTFFIRVNGFSTKALIAGTNEINSNQIKSNQMLVFVERAKRSTRRKTSRSRVENQETQPTYDAEAGNRTRATCTLVGGECSHHCATPVLEKRSSDRMKLLPEFGPRMVRRIQQISRVSL